MWDNLVLFISQILLWKITGYSSYWTKTRHFIDINSHHSNCQKVYVEEFTTPIKQSQSREKFKIACKSYLQKPIVKGEKGEIIPIKCISVVSRWMWALSIMLSWCISMSRTITQTLLLFDLMTLCFMNTGICIYV